MLQHIAAVIATGLMLIGAFTVALIATYIVGVTLGVIKGIKVTLFH